MTRTASLAALVTTLAVVACATPPATVSTVPGTAPPRACPDWNRASREDFTNRTSSNFGCADALNLRAQLADPADAVRGRSSDTGDANGAVTAIERLRSGKVQLPPAADAPATGAARPGPGA